MSEETNIRQRMKRSRRQNIGGHIKSSIEYVQKAIEQIDKSLLYTDKDDEEKLAPALDKLSEVLTSLKTSFVRDIEQAVRKEESE